ncbi:MAG: peptidylprolyl isomerase [Acidobacteriota bacterium]
MHARSAPILFVIAAAAVSLCGCGRSIAPNVAATVNGRSIPYSELDKQYQIAQFGEGGQAGQQGAGVQSEKLSEDEVTLQRLEILRAMIDNEVMFQRAEREGLLATDSEVEAKFSELKTPYTEEEFKKQLNDRKMTVEESKTQLRRELSVQKLLNKETTSKISITDQDITTYYTLNKAAFNRVEPQILLAQILVTPVADTATRNLKGDNAADEEAAKTKIETLYQRLKKGEDFGELAQNYSEDPDSAPTGGSLGFVQESALDKANPDLRKAIIALRPGQITPIMKTSEGYRILKLITREPAGQRGLNDPSVQQTIRETLINRKDQLLRAAFYEVARNEAAVVNYFATSVGASDGKSSATKAK